MGHMIEEIAISRGHEIACRIDVDNQADFDSPAFRSADVAIEFTAPAVAYSNIRRAFDAGVKVVSGSTGWYADHAAEMQSLCADGAHTLFWSSNFSVGVYLFGLVNRYLARLMNRFPDYSPAMTEVHHVHKLDHPSGTAITLAQQLIDEVGRINGYAAFLQPDSPKPPASPHPRAPSRASCPSPQSAAARCPAYTPSPGTAPPMPSPSPTTHTPAAASPSEPSSLPNTPPHTPDSSPWTICSAERKNDNS